MTKDAQKHLFDKFFRVESAMTQKTEGAGLGLSISREIVLAHKGTIEVESQIGKGTTVRVKLPINQPKKG